MSSDLVLDIESLIRPIPGSDSPGGVPMPEALRAELERLRTTSLVAADPGSTKRPAPDFRAIISDATEALTNTSKDIGLVLRLVEAATRVHGVAGLRDGLRLIHRMVGECWDWVHPTSPSGRGNRFKWLNSATGGAEFPLTIQRLPLIICRPESFSYFDTLDPVRNAEMEKSLADCSPNQLVSVYADLTAAMTALRDLAKELNQRLGENAPDLTGPSPETDTNLGGAIRNCLQTVTGVAARKNVTLDGSQPDTGTGTPPPETREPAAAPVGGSRESLYQQLDRIAVALKGIEPHSPVPYLLERCVKLGKLPFPDLMKSVLKDSVALGELDRLLGLDSPG